MELLGLLNGGTKRVAAAKHPAGSSAPVPSPGDPRLTALLAAGAALLDRLAHTVDGPACKESSGASAEKLASLVRRDTPDGEPYLRLPLPQAEVLQKLLDALSKWVGG